MRINSIYADAVTRGGASGQRDGGVPTVRADLDHVESRVDSGCEVVQNPQLSFAHLISIRSGQE